MIQLTDTLYSILVDSETSDYYISGANFLCCNKPKKRTIEALGFDKFRIIGIVTKDTIDFDCEKYLGQKRNGCYTFPTNFLQLLNSKEIYFENKFGEL